MHERKRLMYDLADAFVALPGGLGTLEELAEVLTWNQLGILAKPVALLDVAGSWDGLVDVAHRAPSTPASSAPSTPAALGASSTRSADVLPCLAAAEVRQLDKWLDLEEA